MPVRSWYQCNSPWDFHSTIISWLFRAPPSAQHWPLTALLRGVVLLDFIWQGLRAETALPEREKNLNIAERPKCLCILWPSLLKLLFARCCHPLGSSCCCFSEPVPAPSHRMLLMPELSNQLCSSCEHGSALLQIARVLPATWETATESSQSLAFAWHSLVLLLFTGSSGTCQAQGGWRIFTRFREQRDRSFREGRWGSALLPEQNQNHLILPEHTVSLFWRLNGKQRKMQN